METTIENKIILTIDEEESICRTLSTIFKDEGFSPLSASNGTDGLALLEQITPALVLLDIWMPGLDGLEVLQKIKKLHPTIPVVMISGHATISTAIQATHMGAADFIEKPLELDSLLRVIKNVLALAEPTDKNSTVNIQLAENQVSYTKSEDIKINPVVFGNPKLLGKKLVQKTLKNSSILYGHGVHTGKRSGLILEPLGTNCGIHFISVTSTQAVPAHLDYVFSTGYATTLKNSDTSVSTIEHLMSALHAYGITNLLIKCNGEVPVMDGSALEFCNLFEQIGIVEQDAYYHSIQINTPIRIGNEKEYILLEPADEFSIDYTLQYPEPIGKQFLSFKLSSPQTYKEQIAPARTFGFVKDIGALQKMGLAQGGRFDNFVLVGNNSIINDNLRFPDEPVRHKILDMIGDFYLMGRPINGKVTACMTGHSDNIELLKSLKQIMSNS